MNYKKIFKNDETRAKILKILNFIPDRMMIKLQYRIKTGRKLNLKNPKRYTEKIQWYKLNYRNPVMHQCVDKYTVRDYVKQKGLGHILNQLYGIYENIEEIDLNHLPNKFVLKANNGSHANIFCEDKSKLDMNKVKEKLNPYLKIRKKLSGGREWAYKDIEPRIVCEKYLEKDENGDIVDYKFYCFNGKPEYLNIIKDRKGNNITWGMFNLNFELLPVYRKGQSKIEETINIPSNFSKMIEIAKILSEDFPHVRVDLYNIKGKIYFGELTFYPASGYEEFEPDEFDFKMGEKFELPMEREQIK